MRWWRAVVAYWHVLMDEPVAPTPVLAPSTRSIACPSCFTLVYGWAIYLGTLRCVPCYEVEIRRAATRARAPEPWPWWREPTFKPKTKRWGGSPSTRLPIAHVITRHREPPM